jgi:Xaa-Pro aminopeptidase
MSSIQNIKYQICQKDKICPLLKCKINFMNKPDYLQRRLNFTDKLEPNSACVILSNEILYKNADTEFTFRQDSNFWYLTGIDEPDSALFIIKGEDSFETQIFVREKVKAEEIWTGYRLGLENAKTLVQADKVFKFGDLTEQIAKIPRNITKFYFKSFSSNYTLLRQRILEAYPKRFIFEMTDPDLILGEMRLIKEPIELEYMRQAAKISIEAHRNCQKMIQTGNFEYQVQAELEYRFRLENTAPAYPSIVASGENATVLHYSSNQRKLESGDLVLIDAACEYQNYSSDITRTYVVGGKYTDAQKKIYDIVLKAHGQAVKEAATQGKNYKDVHIKAVVTLVAGLVDLGLLKGSIEENIAQKTYLKYYMHGTSHWLGLDTHDLGSITESNSDEFRILKPNMVLTIEPGLYFDAHDETIPAEFRGIGIRLEDDILITETGVENLTKDLEI